MMEKWKWLLGRLRVSHRNTLYTTNKYSMCIYIRSLFKFSHEKQPKDLWGNVFLCFGAMEQFNTMHSYKHLATNTILTLYFLKKITVLYFKTLAFAIISCRWQGTKMGIILWFLNMKHRVCQLYLFYCLIMQGRKENTEIMLADGWST